MTGDRVMSHRTVGWRLSRSVTIGSLLCVLAMSCQSAQAQSGLQPITLGKISSTNLPAQWSGYYSVENLDIDTNSTLRVTGHTLIQSTSPIVIRGLLLCDRVPGQVDAPSLILLAPSVEIGNIVLSQGMDAPGPGIKGGSGSSLWISADSISLNGTTPILGGKGGLGGSDAPGGNGGMIWLDAWRVVGTPEAVAAIQGGVGGQGGAPLNGLGQDGGNGGDAIVGPYLFDTIGKSRATRFSTVHITLSDEVITGRPIGAVAAGVLGQVPGGVITELVADGIVHGIDGLPGAPNTGGPGNPGTDGQPGSGGAGADGTNGLNQCVRGGDGKIGVSGIGGGGGAGSPGGGASVGQGYRGGNGGNGGRGQGGPGGHGGQGGECCVRCPVVSPNWVQFFSTRRGPNGGKGGQGGFGFGGPGGPGGSGGAGGLLGSDGYFGIGGDGGPGKGFNGNDGGDYGSGCPLGDGGPAGLPGEGVGGTAGADGNGTTPPIYRLPKAGLSIWGNPGSKGVTPTTADRGCCLPCGQ